MAAALGGLGLLRGRLRLRLAAAAASPPSFSSSSSSSSSSSASCLGPRAAVRGGAAARPAAGRSYGSEAKEEEELRVRYLDDEHKGGHGNRYCLLIKEKNKGLEVSQETYASYASLSSTKSRTCFCRRRNMSLSASSLFCQCTPSSSPHVSSSSVSVCLQHAIPLLHQDAYSI